MKKTIFIFAIFAFAAVAAHGFGTSGGAVTDEGHSFFLNAPEGWVFDNESGKSQGMPLVFYPKVARWETALVVMYANVSRKKPGDKLEKLIEFDISQFKKASPNLVVKDAPSLPTARNKKAVVKHFSNDAYGNFEAVAYIDEPGALVMVVLTSKTKAGFDKALPAFAALLKSYYATGK
jgi:hypothetical protein